MCALLTAGRRRVYLVEQKGAGISLLCVWVTYCRKEEGLPGRAEGCRNITSLHVGFLLQEGGGCTWRFRRMQEYHSCVWVTFCRKEGVPGGSEVCTNITPLLVGYLLQEGGGCTCWFRRV